MVPVSLKVKGPIAMVARQVCWRERWARGEKDVGKKGDGIRKVARFAGEAWRQAALQRHSANAGGAHQMTILLVADQY